MKQTIDLERYYKPSEVIEFHPILKTRGLQYLYNLRKKSKQNLFINTAPNGGRPSWLIRGKDLQKFIDQFDKSVS